MPAKNGRADSLRVAAYYRMSDDKQEGSIARQQAAVRPYCQSKGYAVVRVYTDEGIPGDRLDRPAFQRLLADARRGLFSRIVVDEPSRLARSPNPLDFLADVARPLRDAGVSVDSVSDGIQDWSDLADLILATVRADRSTKEVRNLSRRVLGGCLRALGAGRLPGGTPPYGYVKREGRWETDALRADAMRYAFARYDRGGITLEGLAGELAERGYPPPERKGSRRKGPPAWTWSVLKRLLKNPAYTGAVVWGRRSQGKYSRINGAPGRADGGRRSEANGPEVTRPSLARRSSTASSGDCPTTTAGGGGRTTWGATCCRGCAGAGTAAAHWPACR
jgi:site-specific DNA recombinase